SGAALSAPILGDLRLGWPRGRCAEAIPGPRHQAQDQTVGLLRRQRRPAGRADARWPTADRDRGGELRSPEAEPVLLRDLRAEGLPLAAQQGGELPELHSGEPALRSRSLAAWLTPTPISPSASPRRRSWWAARARPV